MKKDKAREFYSGFYEGSLDPAMQQTLEARMRADSDLRADYEAFEASMAQLDALKAEEIEIPIFLSDRIATRLEEASQKQKSPLFALNQWVRGLAFAGLAGAALLGALAAIPNKQPGSLGTGSMLDALLGLVIHRADVQTVEHPNFIVSGTQVTVEFKPSAKKTLVLEPLGEPQKAIKILVDEGSRSISPLKNPNTMAALFVVSVEGDAGNDIVAVPGSVPSSSPTGEGRISDFAGALADFYRAPVLLEVENTEAHVKWAFTAKDPVSAATNALQPLQLVAGLRNNGLVLISDH